LSCSKKSWNPATPSSRDELVLAVQSLLAPIWFIRSGVAPPVAHVTPKRVQRNDCMAPSVVVSRPKNAGSRTEQSSSSVTRMMPSCAVGRGTRHSSGCCRGGADRGKRLLEATATATDAHHRGEHVGEVARVVLDASPSD